MIDIAYEIFSLVIFIIGFVLIQSTIKIDTILKAECTNSSLRTANKIILIISTICIGLTIGGVLCRLTCDCPGNRILSTEGYIGMIFLLGIAILVLGIIIKSNANNTCSSVSKPANNIIAIGAVMTVLCVIYFFMVYKFDNSVPRSTHQPQAQARAQVPHRGQAQAQVVQVPHRGQAQAQVVQVPTPHGVELGALPDQRQQPKSKFG